MKQSERHQVLQDWGFGSLFVGAAGLMATCRNV